MSNGGVNHGEAPTHEMAGPGTGHAGGSGGGQGGGHGRDGEDGTDGLGQILARQWHVVLLTTLAMAMLCVLYALLAKPVYTSMSELQVAPVDPSIASSGSSGNQQEDTDFLDTQCAVIKSNAVLALALDKIKATATLRNQPHPLDYVKAHMLADPAKQGKAIDVSFESTSVDDANLIVNSIVEAYTEYESKHWKKQAETIQQILQHGTDEQKTEMQGILNRMQDLRRQIGSVPDADPDKSPLHMEVANLEEEKRKAELEVIRAKSANQQASKAVFGHEKLVKQVDKVEADNLFTSTDPEAQLKGYQTSLDAAQRMLIAARARYGPNYPALETMETQVDDLVVDTVVAADQWVQKAEATYTALEDSLKVARKAEQDQVTLQSEYKQLALDLERLERNSSEVSDRIRKIDIGKSTGAIDIAVLDEAEIVGKPKPDKLKTTAIGVVLGIIGGLGLAFLRDWTDDRMRTPQAVRMAAGAQVLGGIPNITTGYTAADRGQIVYHEPFGDAAESFRTLRTALQFGLPAGCRTILITSAVSGDGKSTVVSNLGIAMAQAKLKVLVIDADLRAPMQHRLFGLEDRIGLANVLDGAETLEQAVQQTGVKGLDVLPCGPIPPNPSELLNSPLFAEKLEELADQYDVVLLDSPPITAVADARIIAACADVSMLVIRLQTTHRKHAEAARDGLRSVGARLVGVAINGISRNSGFGSATAYYPQHASPAAFPVASRGFTEHSAGRSQAPSNPAGQG